MAISSRNEGWQVGVTIGKAGKKKLWEISYRYKVVEGDAWYEELGESDYGAFYQAQMPNAGFTGGGGGYGAGTNLRGHIARISYSPFDALTLTATYYKACLIDEVPPGSNSDMGRLIVDAMWRF